MGNRNTNQINNIISQEQGQNLLQNSQINLEQASVKKVMAIRNPIYLRKQTLILERDASSPNLYYIKFYYDSLVNFNCFINFNVTQNISKKTLNKKDPLSSINSKSENYILSYIPTKEFISKTITLKGLKGGENIEFFSKEANIDIDYFLNNKIEMTNDNKQTYDIAIELVPIFPSGSPEYDENNEIVFVTLCKIKECQNGDHPFNIKAELQRLKTHDMWIDFFDVFNSALENGVCLICCSESRNTIFLPCKHACTCNSCGLNIKMRNSPCPICKTPIDDLLILESEEKQIDGEIIEIEDEPPHQDNINDINNINNMIDSEFIPINENNTNSEEINYNINENNSNI